MPEITLYEVPSEAAREAVERLADRGVRDLADCEQPVRAIIEAVRRDGDEALRVATQQLEGRVLTQIEVGRAAIDRAPDLVTPEFRRAVDRAVDRVREYHRRQVEPSWTYSEGGVLLGEMFRPVHRVGVYAPGGTARHPSSVIMNVVPARVAGVEEVFLATPSPSPEVLCAARIAGVDRVFDVGGAQAIAALAVGTESVPPVEMIVGPGNRYVVAAKRAVFGEVAIDLLAGPAEIVIIADAGARPDVVAADLLAQAEHDEAALAVLITDDAALARSVIGEVDAQLPDLPRQMLARKALRQRGAVFVVPNLEEAVHIADHLAPEHLVLAVARADPLIRRVRAAGAVLVGYHTPVVVGDYLAGPSHTLPTGGSARFASPLGVHSFLVRSALVRYGPAALRRDAPILNAFADVEGLVGHRRTVERRLAAKGRPPTS